MTGFLVVCGGLELDLARKAQGSRAPNFMVLSGRGSRVYLLTAQQDQFALWRELGLPFGSRKHGPWLRLWLELRERLRAVGVTDHDDTMVLKARLDARSPFLDGGLLAGRGKMGASGAFAESSACCMRNRGTPPEDEAYIYPGSTREPIVGLQTRDNKCGQLCRTNLGGPEKGYTIV